MSELWDDPDEIICGVFDRGDAGKRVIDALWKHDYVIVKRPSPSDVERVARAIETEREACAKIAEERSVGKYIAKAIRARGISECDTSATVSECEMSPGVSKAMETFDRGLAERRAAATQGGEG